MPDAKEEGLIPQRILFAEKMKDLLDSGRAIIYADETTFKATVRPGKTWMRGHRLVAPRNLQQLKSVTVYGAICKAVPRPVFFTSHTTNAEEFGRFIDYLKDKTSHLQRPVLVLDNHPAHRTGINMAKMLSHFEVVFQPAYSSEANAQETVWAQVKALYLQKLYRRTTNLTTQRAFDVFLSRFLEKAGPKVNPVQTVKAPNWWLHAH